MAGRFGRRRGSFALGYRRNMRLARRIKGRGARGYGGAYRIRAQTLNVGAMGKRLKWGFPEIMAMKEVYRYAENYTDCDTVTATEIMQVNGTTVAHWLIRANDPHKPMVVANVPETSLRALNDRSASAMGKLVDVYLDYKVTGTAISVQATIGQPSTGLMPTVSPCKVLVIPSIHATLNLTDAREALNQPHARSLELAEYHNRKPLRLYRGTQQMNAGSTATAWGAAVNASPLSFWYYHVYVIQTGNPAFSNANLSVEVKLTFYTSYYNRDTNYIDPV